MMKKPEPIARSGKPVFLLVLGVLALAGFLRFFMLSEIGIRGSDTLYYLAIAKGWAVAPEYKREVIDGIYALVVGLGGGSDWSIKSLNAGLDVFSVLLVFAISLRVSRRSWVALMSALSYALLPRAIAFARTELFHTAATSFLLGSFAFLTWYLTTEAKTTRMIHLGLSGLLIGLGYGVHEDLMPFVPGMVACLPLAALEGSAPPGRAPRLRVGTALAHTGFFLAIVISVTTPLGLWRTLIPTATRLEREFEAGPGTGGEKASLLVNNPDFSYPQMFTNMVEFNSSALVAFLFFALLIAAVALGFMAYRHPPTRDESLARESARPIGVVGFAPAILVCSWLLVYPFTNSYVDPRHFLAALPLVLMSVFVWMDWVIGRLLRDGGSRSALYALAALAVILVNFSNNPTRSEMSDKLERRQRLLYHLSYAETVPESPKDSFDSSKYPISPYRVVYDLLSERVDDQNRLLVTPYVLISDDGRRRGFRHYFGDDAVYIEDCKTSLGEYIDDRRVRYVVFAGFDHRPLARTPVCYGLGKDQYSLQKEWALLTSYLLNSGHWLKTLSKNDAFVLLEVSGKRPRAAESSSKPGSTVKMPESRRMLLESTRAGAR